jgi:hypothetical protein
MGPRAQARVVHAARVRKALAALPTLQLLAQGKTEVLPGMPGMTPLKLDPTGQHVILGVFELPTLNIPLPNGAWQTGNFRGIEMYWTWLCRVYIT